jgi:phosphohistidine phosphatase
MGTALSQLIEPMAITVSPARRAQLTLAGLCDGWPALAALEHITDENLYTFSSTDHLRWIAGQEEGQDAIFIISHNPGLTDLINSLTRGFTLANLPTAGYVQLSLDIDRWNHLEHCVAVLEHSLFPKQLK